MLYEVKVARGLSRVSYQKRIDEMIGKHVASYQAELSLANEMSAYRHSPSMPYGYPPRIYHPYHFCQVPQYHRFVAQTGGRLSNGVPRVLSAEWENGTLLGIYNPKH